LDSDFGLALLKRLQRTRPDLRLVVMSATLDAAPVALYLEGCPILRSEGRLFELTIRHLPYSPALLHVQVKSAVEFFQNLYVRYMFVYRDNLREAFRSQAWNKILADQTSRSSYYDFPFPASVISLSVLDRFR
jgi:HrpA-like RNA helicase